MQEKLLELLSQKNNCFISTLPLIASQQSLLHVLQDMTDQPFALDEWRYCLQYLFHEEVAITNMQDVKQFLNKKTKSK